MAAVFKNSTGKSAYTSGTITTDAGINIAVGDLIVVGVGTNDSTIDPSGLSDSLGNSYTLRAVIDSTNNSNLMIAWCVAANAGSATFTASFGAGSATKYMNILVFTPDAGDTVTLDVANSGSSGWGSSPWQTGTGNTTGTDEIIVAFFHAGAGMTYSNHEIPSGTAATAISSANANAAAFYRIATDAISGCMGEVDVTAAQAFAAEFVAFKSAAGGGGGHVQIEDRYSKIQLETADALLTEDANTLLTEAAVEATTDDILLEDGTSYLLLDVTYTLACEAGSFSLSGQDVSLKAGRKVDAGVGAFSLSGQEVALKRGYTLVASAGSFALTGQVVDLRKTAKVAADAGSFTLTGQAVALKHGYILAAGAGSFALTGQVVALKAGHICAAGTGAFVLTGQDVALRYSGAAAAYSLACEAGTFVLTGKDVALSKAAAKAASTGGRGKIKPRWRDGTVPVLRIIGSRGISAQPLQISQGSGAVIPAQIRIGGAGDSIQPRQESMGRASIDYELLNERELIELLILDAA